MQYASFEAVVLFYLERVALRLKNPTFFQCETWKLEA